jgi:hypothetical protein
MALMNKIINRLTYLFRSPKGLVLLAVAFISIVTVIWGMLSGPLADLGFKDLAVRLFGMDLEAAEREGRIIMLYHSIAMAVVAILVYFATASIPMKKSEQRNINCVVTVGYITAMISGLFFAYFGHNWAAHGVYLVGLSLVFFAGILLAVALWPWRKDYRKAPTDTQTRGQIDLERTAFFTVAVTFLISAVFGAVPGSYFGNGFEVFLAEDTIREPAKAALDLSIIGHLHIMVALLGMFLTLLVGRWMGFKGTLHKIAMPSAIAGSIILSFGVWMVVPFETIAHLIIYVGSVPLLMAGLFLVVFGFGKLIRERLAEQGIENATFWQKLKALVHDPLKFGQLWQMVYMNFVVTFVGLFMAAKLEDIMRWWPARDERTTLTGHWHILSAIIASIILLRLADMSGLKGKIRKLFGWVVIVGTDLAFLAAVLFALKRLFVTESGQQPIVDTTMVLIDIGLGAVTIVLGALMIWRLVDLFKKKGLWEKEQSEEGAAEEVSK